MDEKVIRELGQVFREYLMKFLNENNEHKVRGLSVRIVKLEDVFALPVKRDIKTADLYLKENTEQFEGEVQIMMDIGRGSSTRKRISFVAREVRFKYDSKKESFVILNMDKFMFLNMSY